MTGTRLAAAHQPVVARTLVMLRAPRWRRPQPATAVLGLITLFTALRLISACFIGLGVDESYSVAVARDLHLSYFDHPPLHYWIAHAVEPFAGAGRASRIPFIALFAGSSWLMFLLTRNLFGARAGFWAVASLNLSGFFTTAAASWVLPDGPLMFFLLAAAAIVAKSGFCGAEPAAPSERCADAHAGWPVSSDLRAGSGSEIHPRPIETPIGVTCSRPVTAWLAIGLCVGMAGLSKYQAALFCLGLGLYLITTSRGRRQLLSPGPYLAAAVALVVLTPVLVWNAGHDWASFSFQAGRGAPARLHLLGPLVAVAGQGALLLPWIFAPLATAAMSALRQGPTAERRWFCVMLAAPAITVFTLTPLFGPPALPHWSMPGWLLLFPLLGDLLARAAQESLWPRLWIAASFAFVLLAGALTTHEAATGWIGERFPATFAHRDPSAESIEWSQLRAVVGRNPLLHQPGAFIAALKWNEAGKIDQAVGDLAPVALLSDDQRQFGYRHATAGYVGGDALVIGRLTTVEARLASLRMSFQSVRLLAPLSVGRSGRSEILLGLVEAHGLKRSWKAATAHR